MELFQILKWFVVVFYWIFCFETGSVIGSTVFERDLKITLRQKALLDKFREKVINKLPHAYMKEDIFLIGWLRVENFDIKRAEEMLLDNLRWRKTNKMDSILNEDWTDMEADYPYTKGLHEKQGEPVFIVEYGRWDTRAAGPAGKFPRLIRYMERMAEEISVLVRQFQEDGRNITRCSGILDVDGFNLIQHACPQCMFNFFRLYSSFEVHYPALLNKIYVVNASPIFQTILQTVLPQVAPRFRDVGVIYGQDYKQYSKALLKYFDKDQLPVKYGGSKVV